jgi:hypothetical protein
MQGLRPLWDALAKLHLALTQQSSSGDRDPARSDDASGDGGGVAAGACALALLELCAAPNGPLRILCEVYSRLTRWAAQLQDAETLSAFVIELLSWAKSDRLWKGKQDKRRAQQQPDTYWTLLSNGTPRAADDSFSPLE